MYRRILVPVSAPQEVEPLVRFGADLLDPGGEIRVLHVIPAVNIPEVTRLWRASVNIVVPAHEAGAALDIPVEPEVRSGKEVASEILESAETHSTDALLFTLGGDRRSRSPFVGRTATALLQHAPCDVLIANRLALTGAQYDKILLPSLSGEPPRKALLLAEQVAVRQRGLPIVSLDLASGQRRETAGPPATAGETPESTSGDLEELSGPRGLFHERRRVSLPARILAGRRGWATAILSASQRERYGLLLVAEDPAREEGPLLTRRFVEELFRQAPCPVVALRG